MFDRRVNALCLLQWQEWRRLAGKGCGQHLVHEHPTSVEYFLHMLNLLGLALALNLLGTAKQLLVHTSPKFLLSPSLPQ